MSDRSLRSVQGTAAWLSLFLVAALGAFFGFSRDGWSGQLQAPDADTALVVSVDVSNSVDETRYKLQMEGIAQALEDPEVLRAILSGPQGGILFSMVTWADRPQLVIPWQRVSNEAQAKDLARRVRALPRQTGEFTCVSKMLRNIADKVVPQIPGTPARIIVDVSGDGRENCNPEEPPTAVRDELAESGVTVNGLPILEGDEGPLLEGWYRENILAGPSAFLVPADGFKDFGRAIRQKFMVEISWLSERVVR